MGVAETPTASVGRFRKKPVEVDAVRWTGENISEVFDFLRPGAGGYIADHESACMGQIDGALYIRTLEGALHVTSGDWIIRGVKGEFYPCTPDIFEAAYEPLDLPEAVEGA